MDDRTTHDLLERVRVSLERGERKSAEMRARHAHLIADIRASMDQAGAVRRARRAARKAALVGLLNRLRRRG